MSEVKPRRILFFVDRIEQSSYPVTETGYALVYRAFLRAEASGGEVYVAYPDSTWLQAPNGNVRVQAHRVLSFRGEPYGFYQSQRTAYRPGAHVGSPACHEQAPAATVRLEEFDAVVWRQETGDPEQARALLRALEHVEQSIVVYQSPRLALDPERSSKVIPRLVDPRLTPKTHHTVDSERTTREKAERAVAFIRTELGAPATVIAKPLHGDNGIGVHVLGRDPRTGVQGAGVDDIAAWSRLIELYGDLVVQEYITSVRGPMGSPMADLAAVPHDRRDFGEIRFILIDGELPRLASGEPCKVARRVPAADSLIADSGISHATSLSAAEIEFLGRVGALYREWGVHFGGGDLIRTPDPERPFVFTDAAQSVCGHAVVTGALNGEPYMIVDRVLDSLERQIRRREGESARPIEALVG